MMNQCSIPDCCEEGITFFSPPLCERHWEIVLLMSQAERQGIPVTPEWLIVMKRRSPVAWRIQDHELPQLLAEVQAVPA